jgi:hypothetical protein
MINRGTVTKVFIKKTAIFLFLAIFFFLAGFHEFLHNHQHDTEEHSDCPVHIFLLVGKAAGTLGFFLLSVSWLVLFFRRITGKKAKCCGFVYSYHIRGPPSLSSSPSLSL